VIQESGKYVHASFLYEHAFNVFRSLGGLKAIGIMAPIDPKDWNTVSDVVGCGTGEPHSLKFMPQAYFSLQGNDNAQMDCMKKVPYRILEDAVISTGANFFLVIDSVCSSNQNTCALTVFLDITIFSDWEARTIAGSFLKVPLLAGSTQHEGDLSLVVQQDLSLGFSIPILTETLSALRGQVCRPMNT